MQRDFVVLLLEAPVANRQLATRRDAVQLDDDRRRAELERPLARRRERERLTAAFQCERIARPRDRDDGAGYAFAIRADPDAEFGWLQLDRGLLEGVGSIAAFASCLPSTTSAILRAS